MREILAGVVETSAVEAIHLETATRATSVDTHVEAFGQMALQERPSAHVGSTPTTSTVAESHVGIDGASTSPTEAVPVAADEDEGILANSFWSCYVLPGMRFGKGRLSAVGPTYRLV